MTVAHVWLGDPFEADTDAAVLCGAELTRAVSFCARARPSPNGLPVAMAAPAGNSESSTLTGSFSAMSSRPPEAALR